MITLVTVLSVVAGCARPSAEVDAETTEKPRSSRSTTLPSAASTGSACMRTLDALDRDVALSDAGSRTWLDVYELSLTIDETTLSGGTSPDSDLDRLDELIAKGESADEGAAEADEEFAEAMASCDLDELPQECRAALELYDAIGDAYFDVLAADREVGDADQLIAEAYDSFDMDKLREGVEAYRPALDGYRAAVDAWSSQVSTYDDAAEDCQAALG